MKSADLMAEAETYAAGLRGHLAQIGQLGILPGVAEIGQVQPPLGLSRIRRQRNELWEPEPAGALAMIVPVCVPVIVEPFEGFEIETSECIDLVAFNSREPDRWSWRTGTAWALSQYLIEEYADPLHLVSTPLAWLRSGGATACILDWSDTSPAWPHLRSAGQLKVEDPELKRRIDLRLRQTVRLPRVEVGHAA